MAIGSDRPDLTSSDDFHFNGCDSEADVTAAIKAVSQRLFEGGVEDIVVFDLTPERDDLSVVRVLVPGLVHGAEEIKANIGVVGIAAILAAASAK